MSADDKYTGIKTKCNLRSLDCKDEVSKIRMSLLCVWRSREQERIINPLLFENQFLISQNGFKWLTHVKLKMNQFYVVDKS